MGGGPRVVMLETIHEEVRERLTVSGAHQDEVALHPWRRTGDAGRENPCALRLS